MTGAVLIEPLRPRESVGIPFVLGQSNVPILLELGPGQRHSWGAQPEGRPYAGHLLVRLCVNVLQGAVDVCAMGKDGKIFHQASLTSGGGWRQIHLITPVYQDLGAVVVRNSDANGSSRIELVFVNASPAYDCFLIYQPGKVGSQTLELALNTILPGGMVERHHFLSNQERERAMNPARIGALDDAGRRYFHGPGGMAQQVAEADRAHARLESLAAGETLLIIGIRDPISYPIAAFFQNIDVYCPWLTYELDRVVPEAAAVLQYFMQQLGLEARKVAPTNVAEVVVRGKLRHPGTWFETEFKWYTSIDAYSMPLGERPFTTFRAGKLDVLFYRYEQLGANMGEMLRSVGLCPVNVPRQNVGREKVSGEIYAEFMRTFQVTDDVRKVLLDNAYTRHFYPKLLAGANAAG